MNKLLSSAKSKFKNALTYYLEDQDWKQNKTIVEQSALWLAHRIQWTSQIAVKHSPGNAELWCGDTASGVPLRVAFISDGHAEQYMSPPYLRHELFSADGFTIESRGSVPFRKINSTAQRLSSEVDLVIVERNRLLSWRPSNGTSLVVPCWISMWIDLSPQRSWQEIEKAMSRHATNIKKARRNGYAFRFSHDPADFELFYDRMLIPTVKGRFEDFARIPSRPMMEILFQHGGLSIVQNASGQVVAAELDWLRGNVGTSVANGILDGDETYYASGAMSAVYYFRTRWCYENGITAFNAGACRPFTSDGVYEYKRRWGFRPVTASSNSREWLIWAPGDAPVALDWIQAHPLVQVQT